MEVKNQDGSINIKGEYIEIATIFQVLDDFANKQNDEYVRQLAQEIHNPKVVK